MAYIDILPDVEWFRLFYLLAMGTGLWLVLRAAWRSGMPMSVSLSLFIWVAVGGVLGSKLLELPAEGWSALWQTGGAGLDVGRTALGGLLGGMAGLAAGRRVLGVGREVWGWFAGWPAVLILFRAGCLLVGCCIGAPTGLPWGLSYPLGTDVAGHQHAAGLIGEGATCTVAAHPVPVYEMLFGLAALVAVGVLLRRGWRGERVFFASVLGYAVFRFVEEFIRVEHVADGWLNPVQWGLLAAMPVLLVQVLRARGNAGAGLPEGARAWAGLLLPLAVVLWLRGFWTPAEYLSLGAAFVAYAGAKWHELSGRGAGWRHWLAAPASVLMGVMLMGQAAIDQTVAEGSNEEWLNLGASGGLGRYQESCGGVRNYWNAGAGASYSMNWEGKHQLEIGAKGYFGVDHEYDTAKVTIAGGNFNVEYQNRWVGASIGAHGGKLLTDGNERSFLPDLQLRLGPSDLFFAEGRVFNGTYSPIPAPIFRIGIGSGFGLKNGTVFRLGMGNTGIYLHPSIVATKELLIEPMVVVGDDNSYQFSIGGRWRLPVGKKD